MVSLCKRPLQKKLTLGRFKYVKSGSHLKEREGPRSNRLNAFRSYELLCADLD